MGSCKQCGRTWVDKDGARNELHSSGFCSEGCKRTYYKEIQQQKAERRQSILDAKAAAKERKAVKTEKKAEKKAEKEAKAEITSNFNLNKVTKLAICGGFFGVHRLFVGKIISFILINFFTVFGIYSSIAEKSFSMLAMLLVPLIMWGYDIISLKGERFTDGKGHTIRGN